MLNPNNIPLSLYIHIPWCIKKCPYCDFNSHQLAKNQTIIDLQVEQSYIDALITDLISSLDSAHNLQNTKSPDGAINLKPEIHSIFIGGGTPSLFSANGIYKLLNEISKVINIPDDCEITLEANPGTFESQKFYGFKQAGINRLSIGVQSFDDQCLQKLGRVHNSEQAIAAIEYANKIAINYNIDLMHTLPDQTISVALSDLKTAIALAPNHLSWYQLTIEPNTKFSKHPPVLPNPDIQYGIYQNGLDLISKNYQQYEISAYARNDNLTKNQAKHNLNYWRFGDYIGIGAGAHSKLTTSDAIIRQWKQKSPNRYLDSKISKVSGQVCLSGKEIVLEYMMNKLRIFEPITESHLFNSTGKKFIDIELQIKQAKAHKWVTFQNNHLVITDLGRSFLNDLILLFV